MTSAPWPDALWVVRHGESAGNVARDAAEAENLQRIDLAERDVDVPLSERGESQAQALGRWLAQLGPADQPTVLWCSPYLRAQQTAEIALGEAGLDLPWLIDERLREREFGVLDGLTRRGITELFPEESERRQKLGKFYHRPPGGESWCDVLLRLRACLDQLRRDCAGERVLVVAHQVVVLLTRYVIEGMTEPEVLAIDAAGDVANCSVTAFRRDPALGRDAGLVLETFNDVEHIEKSPAPVTAEPDVPAGRR